MPLGIILAEEPGVIPAAFNRTGLIVLRDALATQLDAVQDKLNDLQIAGGVLEILKQTMYKRLGLFIGLLDGYYSSTPYYPARPEAPGMGAGEEKFCSPLRDMKSLWAKLNAAPAPAVVTLPLEINEGTAEIEVNFELTMFTTDLALLQTKYAARAEAEQNLRLARSRRDKLKNQIRAVLVAYRAAALSKLAGMPELLGTLPRVTPLPGHTPDAVTISAVLVPPDTAQVTHSESDDPGFKEYQFRGTVGEDGDAEDAVVLATHSARTPAPFTTQLGLGIPGGAGSYWVFVVTNDGNERASARAVVRRPA